MSVGIVRNEIGNFRPFSKISSFFSQKWFKVYKFWKNDWKKSIFPKNLTIIIVDGDLSFKKS